MEITRSNFIEQLPNITKDLEQSCYVGFDAEFTAILSNECFKHRLFDTSEDRYNKLKTEVSKMIMTQIGLTMFHYDRDSEQYTASGYTFHLCPQVFGDVDQSFIFQASTLKFLCRHNFNFNKFTYEGIPYLSKVEEAKVRKYINDKSLFKNLSCALDMDDEKHLQSQYSEVAQWLSKKCDSETMYLDIDDPVLRFVAHNELRLRFPNILTTDSLGNNNKILIYANKNVEGAKSTPMSKLEENVINHLLGFSRIIVLLENLQKPIIGHNIFLDLVLLHNQFIGPLPSQYQMFKNNMNEMFPKIYDTKHISYDMKRKLTFDESWKSNGLQDLYEYFAENKCKKLQMGVNQIKLKTPFNVKQSYHEAGWDSYCSGYCFIRLGHWAACESRCRVGPTVPSQILAALQPYCAKVNIIRAAIPYMDLSAPDPPRNRPDLLHVESLQERVIDIERVASLLAAYGNVDTKAHGARAALVATYVRISADKILKDFKNSKEYRIMYYNVYRQSVRRRIAMWGGALITGSLMLLLLHKNMKSIS